MPPQGWQLPVEPPVGVMQRVSGAVQSVPVQQGWPRPPQLLALHEPAEQLPPAVPQLVPLAWQVPLTQQPPPAQVATPQQGWPSAPQVWQPPGVPAPVLSSQTVPLALHRLGVGVGVWKQLSPTPPALLQLPALQVPPPPQAPLLATQVRLSVLQQAPSVWQLLSWQHTAPAPPQSVHTVSRQILWVPQLLPLRMHTAPLQQPPAAQRSPAQQAPPGVPQLLQTPALQVSAPLQKLSEQQGCDNPPQVVQAPPGAHTLPTAQASPT